MKLLYVTTIGITMRFFGDYIRELLDEGHEVHIATNEAMEKVPEYYREWGCVIHNISCSRSPLHVGTLQAISQLRHLTEAQNYDIVHCHTPIAAMCTRLACIGARKKGTKVIYTAHGFHFYKGAPLKNWLMYYPMEKLCSYFTDILITINREDYALAKKKMHAKHTEYVPGVGIDVARFAQTSIDRASKRAEIGIPQDATLLISVGELNQNKNHETVICALASMQNPNLHYAVAGVGDRAEYLTELAEELGVVKQVHLLGYRRDVAELFRAADVFIFPSYREGLPVSVMEAMASGLPVAASEIRGNTDLVDQDNNALFAPHSVEDCKAAIEKILASDRENTGIRNTQTIQNFDIAVINQQMKTLYGIKTEV